MKKSHSKISLFLLVQVMARIYPFGQKLFLVKSSQIIQYFYKPIGINFLIYSVHNIFYNL